MSESDEQMTVINIKFETVRDIELFDQVVIVDSLKHEVLDIPCDTDQEENELSSRVSNGASDSSPSTKCVNTEKASEQGATFAKATTTVKANESISNKRRVGDKKATLQPQSKKSKLQIKQESTLFDTAHVCKLIEAAFKFYDMTVSEFALYILKGTDEKLIERLIKTPKVWTKSSTQEKEIFQQMSTWLHKSSKDRIASMNKELRAKGLPEKKIPDPNQTNQPVRKFSKPKTGLRCTSDLLEQLKTELTQLGVSLSEFGSKVLEESDHSGSVLTHPPRLLDELDSKILPKFLTIQQWLCKPPEQKLKPFKS